MLFCRISYNTRLYSLPDNMALSFSDISNIRSKSVRLSSSQNGVFIFIGLVPNTAFLADSGILLDKWGFVVTGHNLMHGEGRLAGYDARDPFLLETSIPGVFAAGDVRDGSTKQVVSAAGEGSSAALMIREYLKGV